MNVHPSLASSAAVRSKLVPETYALTPTCLGIPLVQGQPCLHGIPGRKGRKSAVRNGTGNDKGSGRGREDIAHNDSADMLIPFNHDHLAFPSLAVVSGKHDAIYTEQRPNKIHNSMMSHIALQH